MITIKSISLATHPGIVRAKNADRYFRCEAFARHDQTKLACSHLMSTDIFLTNGYRLRDPNPKAANQTLCNQIRPVDPWVGIQMLPVDPWVG
jgi:hypothetical protein